MSISLKKLHKLEDYIKRELSFFNKLSFMKEQDIANINVLIPIVNYPELVNGKLVYSSDTWKFEIGDVK